jgi:hypothetical protein
MADLPMLRTVCCNFVFFAFQNKLHISGAAHYGHESVAKGRRFPQTKCRTRTENKKSTKRGRRHDGRYASS